MRTLKGQPKWAFWRWQRFDSLHRLIVVRTPWFQIMIHKILGPELDMHDHPWRFWGIVLWGHYSERVLDTRGFTSWVRLRKLFVGCWLHEAHKILNTEGAVTLIFTGRKLKSWGFWTEEKGGWVYRRHP